MAPRSARLNGGDDAMHLLRQYVDNVEGLRGFAAEAAGNAVTQGVVLDINPVWLLAYRLYCAGLGPYAFDMHMPWHFAPGLVAHDLLHLQSIEGDAIDLKWVDKSGWVHSVTRHLLNHSDRNISDSALPFIVKVIARPVSAEFFETRAQLVGLVTRQNFFALIETRPLGTLAAAPGDKCLAGGVPGTIGGFLRDTNKGKVYAATCGHVASKGATVTVSGKHLGVCSHSHAPTQMTPGQSCTDACPCANELDLALIDIGSAAVTNGVTGTAAQIAPPQGIVLRGGASSINSFVVGGHVMTYCPGRSNVCFKNLFEVRPPAPAGIIRPGVSAAFATVPLQGDSGGWLETAAKEWCGVLVAVDHLMGYALEADDTLAAANAAFGVQLQLP
jgi:hypothetical protein